MPDTQVMGDPLSNRLASISRSVEESLLEQAQGIGRNLQITFAPAVPRMSLTSWEGSRQAFWHRFQFLCKEDNPLRLEQGCMLISQIPQHWQGDSDTGQTFADSVASFLKMGKKPSDDLLTCIQEQVLDAAKVQKTSQNLQYQAWLQGAQGKGMGPLFKSLKKGEATTARPHRELSAEVRALARAKVWLKTWKGSLRLEDVPALTFEEQVARDQLRERARQQAAALPPVTASLLKTKFGKGRVTAPGPDGWSKSILKKLTDPMLEDIADLYRQIEGGLRLPQQFMLTQVCMLPKSLVSERPISLTHVLWRDYCRARWDLIRNWSAKYQVQAPWDSAVPGKTSLDVGIRRLVWAEASQTQSRHFIGMFLDIQGFYDSVVWSSVVESGLLLEFPPLVLELALQLYTGERLLSAENSVSPGIFPSVGLLQGCPVAPVVSKLALYAPLKELHAASLTHNIDQWLDDISADIVGATPAQTALKALKCFRTLRDSLASRNLTVSLEKTKFLCSDSATTKVLERMRSDNDPGVTLLAKDLGVDSNAGRRRRLPTSLGRHKKAQNRNRRLRTLGVSSQKARTRLVRGSILTCGTYGHQAQGISPKRMKWLRATLVGSLGRQHLGGTPTVLELFSSTVPDPLEQIVSEHLQVFLRILGSSPSIWEEVQRSWPLIHSRLEASPHPWKVVSGPVSAMIQYAKDMGWDVNSPTSWIIQGQPWPLTFGPFLYQDLRRLIKSTVRQSRLEAISTQFGGEGAIGGLDWTIHRRIVAKGGKKLRFHQAVWQAALVHSGSGGHALCPFCQRRGEAHANTLQHVLWDCSRWQGHPQLSTKLQNLKRVYPEVCLWQRALMPASYVQTPLLNTEERLEGDWPTGPLPEDVVIGTDASGSRFSSDPRLRAVGWAVILARKTPQGLVVLAKASGVLPRPSTIVDGEVHSIAKALELCPGLLDITTDSKVSCQQAISRKVTAKHSLAWKPQWEERSRGKLTWVKAHLSQELFQARFGASEMWRWHLNAAADELAGQRANAAIHPSAKSQLKQIDTLVSTLSSLLSHRAEILITTQNKKTVFCKRIPKAPAMNKRQQIQQLIQLGTSAKGHSWEIKSQHPTNLTATCTKCGLWIQQVDPGPLFQQVLAQPCMGFEGTPPQHLATHPSHQLVSIGKGWQCKVCEGILVARAKQVPKLLLGVCAKRKGTSAISKFTKGLLSGAAAPKSLPVSKKMGKKHEPEKPPARNLSNFFSGSFPPKVEETPLAQAPSEQSHNLPEGKALEPPKALPDVSRPVHPSHEEEAREPRIEETPLDLRGAMAIVRKVKFQNPSNHCYANSLVVCWLWIDLLFGIRSPFLNSPLKGILRWLQSQKKVELWQSLSWTRLANAQGRWESPNSQHDVCHLLMHLAGSVPSSFTQVSWRVVDPGRTADQGNMWPLPLPVPETQVSLGQLLARWQVGVKILTHPPVIALQLGRFLREGARFRRIDSVVDFEDPCVLEGLEGERLVYYPKAVVMHLGVSPLSGHYRSLLLPSRLVTNDRVGAVLAKPADVANFKCYSYLVFLSLQQ